MNIFISWSGERSRAVAMALRDWLPKILQAKPWMSDRDLAAGDRWASVVGEKLKAMHFGIIVLTPDNLSAPWILFEAGALSTSFSASALCPLLVDIDVKDVGGPLSQFQSKKTDYASIYDLLLAINSKAPDPISNEVLYERLEALWPKLEAKLKALPAAKRTESQERSPAQILEELVVRVRSIDARLAMASARTSAPLPVAADAHAVEVEVQGDFPGLDKDAYSVSFSPVADVVVEVAEIAKLDVSDYGGKWRLVDSHGTVLSREDGRRVARQASESSQYLVLTDREFD